MAILNTCELFARRLFDELVSASSISETGNIEKMKGYDGFYKVRFGNYRLGLVFENGMVSIKTVMHRREIYKFFPDLIRLFMSNSDEAISADLGGENTGRILKILVGIGLLIVGFYFFNFNFHILKKEAWWNVFQNISPETGTWGEFGDYVGGILNPVIAAFAFYLIAKTYELQKTELEEARKLLNVSADAQKDQIKLAAITALLNSSLTKIGLLESEKTQWLQSQERLLSKISTPKSSETIEGYEKILSEVENKIWEIESEINELKEKNKGFERQIESLFEGQN